MKPRTPSHAAPMKPRTPSHVDNSAQPGIIAPMAPKIDPDKYMTVGNAAKLANVSRGWMRRLVQGGHVAGIEIDGLTFVLQSAAKAYADTIPPLGRPRGGKHPN